MLIDCKSLIVVLLQYSNINKCHFKAKMHLPHSNSNKYPKLETLHSLCPMISFVEIWHTYLVQKAQGIKKNAPPPSLKFLCKRRMTRCAPTQGPFINYVNRILSIFDPLPLHRQVYYISLLLFSTIYIWRIWQPPFLVYVVYEQPLTPPTPCASYGSL